MCRGKSADIWKPVCELTQRVGNFYNALTQINPYTGMQIYYFIYPLNSNILSSGFFKGSAWFADRMNTNSFVPRNTHFLLRTPICTCTNLYSIISVEQLSLHGAVVNNPFPSREGPANEVNCMPLHCVTHWGLLAAARTPTHQGTVLCFATGLYCSVILIQE